MWINEWWMAEPVHKSMGGNPRMVRQSGLGTDAAYLPQDVPWYLCPTPTASSDGQI